MRTLDVQYLRSSGQFEVWFNQKEQHAINPWHSTTPKIMFKTYFQALFISFYLSKSPLLANLVFFVVILQIFSLELQDSKCPLLANLVITWAVSAPFSWPLSTSCHSDTTWELSRNIFKSHKFNIEHNNIQRPQQLWWI